MHDDRIDEIFARLSEIDLELDPDPISRGPKYLNNLVADCRNYTTEVEKFQLEVAKDLREYQRELLQAEAEFELEFNELITNDPNIKKLQGLSKMDREAMAHNMLEDRQRHITQVKAQVEDLKHVETVVKAKLRELAGVNRDIRLQKQIIRDEIDTGAFWGNDHGNFDAPSVNDEVEVPEDALFEDPEEDISHTHALAEPDYDSLLEDMDFGDISGLGSGGEEEEEEDLEIEQKALDEEQESAKVAESDPRDERPDVGQPTGILQDTEDDEFDFDSALQNLG